MRQWHRQSYELLPCALVLMDDFFNQHPLLEFSAISGFPKRVLCVNALQILAEQAKGMCKPPKGYSFPKLQCFPPQPRAQKLAGRPCIFVAVGVSPDAGETDADGDEATGALGRNFYTSMDFWEIRIDPYIFQIFCLLQIYHRHPHLGWSKTKYLPFSQSIPFGEDEQTSLLLEYCIFLLMQLLIFVFDYSFCQFRYLYFDGYFSSITPASPARR